MAKPTVKKYKFQYAKLVRDNIPEMIVADGFSAKSRVLGRQEYIAELKKKLREECGELTESVSARDAVSEIADVLEVVDCLQEAWQITPAALRQERKRKRLKNGAFRKRIYVEYITNGENADPEWLAYHLKNRRKYPLIK